ncbi:PREDICTED: pentatricopeptide repeat-containing protein At3g25210, mitochondrial [Tarenaya hassleriana]|uniref:pentatricopeptide repeat-containing protein At3g25210, mitochondrial n=1 Tax=Tarenaya hassleriana TaxID=28532 RepID=UPI00053C0CA9|nr:PREDICTED: pentatricopeptide repeat-containing protein At3g25210, mitochondrial [Tarenaya hassleriana]
MSAALRRVLTVFERYGVLSPPQLPPIFFTVNRASLCAHLSSSSSSSPSEAPNPPESPIDPSRTRTRSRTPLEIQFETWIQNLKPGFTHGDVVVALRAQSDPDLAFDIFRWTAQQRGYKHNHETYRTMIKLLTSGKRYKHAETLIEEVIAGACEMSVPLYNSIIRFCCGRKFLFNRAFDVYKKMLRSENSKPNLQTYTLLLNSLLKRFNKLHVCYVYLHAVRSMTKQMKTVGVIPDTFVLNMIIKAYSKCLEVDEAIRVFREMGLYGCEPNAYTYGYITKGLCEKRRVGQGLGFYKEMRSKGMVPNGSCYMVLICSLAMERRLDDAAEVVFDMLGNSMSPDLLTYKTVLTELCRERRGNEALELLEEWKKKDLVMGERNYRSLLDEVYFMNKG